MAGQMKRKNTKPPTTIIHDIDAPVASTCALRRLHICRMTLIPSSNMSKISLSLSLLSCSGVSIYIPRSSMVGIHDRVNEPLRHLNYKTQVLLQFSFVCYHCRVDLPRHVRWLLQQFDQRRLEYLSRRERNLRGRALWISTYHPLIVRLFTNTESYRRYDLPTATPNAESTRAGKASPRNTVPSCAAAVWCARA